MGFGAKKVYRAQIRQSLEVMVTNLVFSLSMVRNTWSVSHRGFSSLILCLKK